VWTGLAGDEDRFAARLQDMALTGWISQLCHGSANCASGDQRLPVRRNTGRS